MKQFLITLFVAMITLIAHAQDVIVKKDGSTILSKVVEVSDSEVKYKKHSNPNGPTYSVKISELISINYQNGEKDTFNISSPAKKTGSDDVPTSVMTVGSQGNSHSQFTSQQSNYNHQQQSTYNQSQMGGPLMYSNQSMTNSLNPQIGDLERRIKKGKRLKWWGFGTGMTVAAIGLGIANSYNDSDIASGMSIWGVGFTGGLTCFFIGNSIAKRAQRELNGLQYSSLYQYEISVGKNNSIAANIDLFSDNVHNQQSLALGINFRF